MSKKWLTIAAGLAAAFGTVGFIAAFGAAWTAAQGTPWSSVVPLAAVGVIGALMAGGAFASAQLMALQEEMRNLRSIRDYSRRSSERIDRVNKKVHTDLRTVNERIDALRDRQLGITALKQQLDEHVGKRLDAGTKELLDTYRRVTGDVVNALEALHRDQTNERSDMAADIVDRLQTTHDLQLERLVGELGGQTEVIDKRLQEVEGTLRDSAGHHAKTVLDQLAADYRQVEALLSIHQTLEPDVPLPPFRNWAVSPDAAAYLVERIVVDRPRVVLEAGSGVSTVLAAYALRRNPEGGKVIALEHDPDYAATTREWIRARGLGDIATVVFAPLIPQTFGGDVYEWYDLSDVAIEEPAGLLFVDGPPGETGSLARYPALPALHDHLAASFVILLDDARRPDEQNIVDRWRAEYSLDAWILKHEKGTAELRRRG